MSVVVMNDENNKCYVYTKGADSFILKCISTSRHVECLSKIESAIEEMASQGLRTLCFAYKEFDLQGRDPLDLTIE